MSTITIDQQKAIADILAGMTLPSGLGDEHSACSLAAINLALSGRLTDDVPDCMSDVIGRWIIGVQDAMPDAMRNSARWKDLLPRAAGTGKMHEAERLKIIIDWMWGTVLPTCQPLADSAGFGVEWLHMTTEKTHAAVARAAAADAAAARAAARAVARAVARAEARAVATVVVMEVVKAEAMEAEAGATGLSFFTKSMVVSASRSLASRTAASTCLTGRSAFTMSTSSSSSMP
jgi:hypothetical protein